MLTLCIKPFTTAPPEESLPPRCAHLWHTRFAPELESLSGIAAEDFAEAEKFAVPRERATFLRVRSFVRQIAARYLGANATQLTCGTDWLAAGGQCIRYAEQHAGDEVACVFSRDEPVRLSFETIDGALAFDDLARSCLTPEQAWPVLIARGDERARIFYELWTRAEVDTQRAGRRVESFSPHPDAIGAVELPDEDWTLLQRTPAAAPPTVSFLAA